MVMFNNLGRTLSLLRELRGKSQARVAREAGIGKSQLSKYENGKELPKFDSLEKVLNALQVGYFEFFYTLHLVDRRAADLERAGSSRAAIRPAAACGRRSSPDSLTGAQPAGAIRTVLSSQRAAASSPPRSASPR